MDDRYTNVARLVDALLNGSGDSSAAIRAAVQARAAAFAGRPDGTRPEVPAAVLPYVDKVTRHAYKITDADVEALLSAGYSEDAIFEITLSAALGAGLARLERALSALKGSGPCV